MEIFHRIQFRGLRCHADRRWIVPLVTFCFIMLMGYVGHTDQNPRKIRIINTLRYQPPAASRYHGDRGSRFNVTTHLLKELGFPQKHFIRLNQNNIHGFVFATASSQNHWKESMDGVASVQKYFPDKRIFYYDLGLAEHQIRHINTWCGVTYRTFNFSKYPEHVRTLRAYAWKPMIVRELLKEFIGVFWMDASVRLNTSDFSPLFNMALKNGGMLFIKTTYHSNHATAHPDVYNYLPSSQARQLTTKQCTATSFMVFRTAAIYWHILHWWFLCALDENCIAPVAKISCSKEMILKNQFTGCHRFDQVAANILGSNYFGYETSRYCLPQDQRLFNLARGTYTFGEGLNIC